MASAPSFAASRPSSTRVIPQIFTRVGMVKVISCQIGNNTGKIDPDIVFKDSISYGRYLHMGKQNRRNYYRVLYLQHDAPAELVKASYRCLMQKLKLHPDLGGDEWNASIINEAYAILSNAEKRKTYDLTLDQPTSAKPTRRHDTAAKPSHHRNHWRKPGGSSSTQRGGPAYCPFCRASAPGHSLSRSKNEQCRVCDSPLAPATKAKGSGKSKRATRRTSIQGDIQFFTRWPQDIATSGQVRNLSPMGMQFATLKSLAENSVIKIEAKGLSAVGRIASCKRADDHHGYLIGVEFLTLSFNDTRGTFVSAKA
ncbi:MAG TPA: J domain-containing protein [Chromatiales bacterium]|nr:J domain-containing protein [Chromatiaceae bacterium]HIO55145.1 J domain-containing protein [Chromatiales bacterium]